MMLPEENSCTLEKNHAVLQLTLSPELFWFRGHFPEQAILPGVAQIHLAMHYAKTLFGLNDAFKGMDVVKFQRPLFPKELVELTLDWDPEKHKLTFQYLSNGISASSGRIALCQ